MTSANKSDFTYSPVQRWSTLTSAILGFALDGYNMLILSFVFLAISKSFGVSITQMGFIFSLQLIFSMLGGVVFGYYADTKGRKLLLMVAIILYSVGALASAFAWNVASLAFFRCLIGIGLGGEWGVGMALYNEVWTSDRRAFGGGLIQGSYLLGIFLAGVVGHWALGAFAASMGWRIALASGFISIIPVVLIRFFMPESKLWEESVRLRKQKASQATVKQPLWAVFSGKYRKYTIIGLLMVLAYMYSFYAVTSIMPTILSKMYKVPAADAAAVSNWVTLLGAAMYFLTGYLGDELGRKKSFLIAQILNIIGFVVLTFYVISIFTPFKGSLWSWPIFLGYLFFYLGSASFAVFGVWFSEIYPTEMRSTGISLCYMIGRGASAIAPLVSAASFKVALITGLIGAVMLFILPLFLQETKGSTLTATETVLEG